MPVNRKAGFLRLLLLSLLGDANRRLVLEAPLAPLASASSPKG
jgi:hypothetical protein